MEPQGAPAQQQHTTIAEKMDRVAGLALFPAMTVMVFLRRRLGYRFLSPVRLLVMVPFIMFFAAIGLSADPPKPTIIQFPTGLPIEVPAPSPLAVMSPLFLFAGIMLITGLAQRYMRRRDIGKGVLWHTYSRGVSWLSKFVPFNDSVVKRYVDPAAVAAIGLAVMFVFKWLGYYFIFSAFCLLLFEAADYEKSLNRMLDVLDAQADSIVMSDNVAWYSQAAPQQRPLDDTAGIPTGIAPDIAAAIERNRARQAAPQPQAPQYPAQPPSQYPASSYPPQQSPFPPQQGYSGGLLHWRPPDNQTP